MKNRFLAILTVLLTTGLTAQSAKASAMIDFTIITLSFTAVRSHTLAYVPDVFKCFWAPYPDDKADANKGPNGRKI